MSKRTTNPRNRRQQRQTLTEMPFCKLVELDPALSTLRAQYAVLSANQRRQAAQWALDGAHATMLFARAADEPNLAHSEWHHAAVPLAIDPEYAPAMLTVGSLEYQYGRIEEAMRLFLELTTLPDDTEDLPEIIDKAGDFLTDHNDHVNAGQLYAAAARAYPTVATYHVGLGYCAAAAGKLQESVAHHRRAVELQPNSYFHLNDLGYSLFQAGQYDEAEKVLQLAAEMAPSGNDLAKANLDHLRKTRGGN